MGELEGPRRGWGQGEEAQDWAVPPGTWFLRPNTVRVMLKWQNTCWQPSGWADPLLWGTGWSLLPEGRAVSTQPLPLLLWGPRAGHPWCSPASATLPNARSPGSPSPSPLHIALSYLSRTHNFFFLSFPFRFFIRMQNIRYHSCNYG